LIAGGAGFDPFNNRLSRDIRNGLSKALLTALEQQDPTPFEVAATCFRQRPDLTKPQAEYLEEHLACYRAVLEQARPNPDPDRVALLFWNHELFFEFHELLEKRWRQASGGEKEILQGLIRAAGTYIHRRYAHAAGAEKMAARARETIEKYREAMPPGFAAAPLLAGLADPAATPPRFGAPTRERGGARCKHEHF
jgi:uncharacterized protein